MSYRSDAVRTGNEKEAEETNAPATEITAMKFCFFTFETGTKKTFFAPFPTSFPLRYRDTFEPFGALTVTRSCLPTLVILPIETFVIALVRSGADATELT